MALATPVSSSRLRNTNPLAVPGRWRVMTHPPMRRRLPLGIRAFRWRGGCPWHLASTAVGHGMRADGETGAVEVGDQTLFVGHGFERRRGVGFGRSFEQRAGAADGAFDLPEGVAAVEEEISEISRLRDFQDWHRIGRSVSFCRSRNLKSEICESEFSAPISASVVSSSLRSSGTRRVRSWMEVKGARLRSRTRAWPASSRSPRTYRRPRRRAIGDVRVSTHPGSFEGLRFLRVLRGALSTAFES